MRAGLRALLVVVLVGAVALVVAQEAAATTPVTFAIADDAAQRAFPSELVTARSIGIGAARAYIGWADVATRRPARPRDPSDAAYDWAQTDADMARYAAAGLPVWVAFWRTPAWASGSSDPAVWPAAASDLGDFAYAVAERYPQVRVFMDWNEPNLKAFAKPNTLAAYEPMARAVYAGVKAASPAAEVIAGNLARYRDGGRDPALWAATLRADDVPMDAFGIHPYPDPAKPLAQCSPRTRIDLFDVPALARIAGVPVAVTEFGWSSDLAGPDNQAVWTAQAIDVARCTPGLAQFVFWGFHDHPVPDGQVPDPWVRYGWLDATGAEKPVFASGTAALAGTPDCTAVATSTGAPPGWPATSAIPPTDRAPECSDVPLSSVAGAAVSADLACSDADGDRLTYTVGRQPAHGALTQAGSSFSYQPDPGFSGTDSFAVSAGDGVEATPFTVTVTVTAPAPAPEPVVALPDPLAAAGPPVAPTAIPAVAASTAVAIPARARLAGTLELRSGLLSVRLACASGGPACAGSLRISARLLGHLRRLTTGTLTVAAGGERTLRLRVPAASRSALRKLAGRTIPVAAVLAVAGGDTQTTTLRLRVPR